MALAYVAMRLALEFVLTFGPLCLILALLLVRCYPGEAHILKHRLKTKLRFPRIRSRWPRRARPAVRHAALLARSPLSRRGPPLFA